VEIEFNILGPPELRVAGRESVAVPPQLWCVLISLLMRPNVPVDAEILIDHLWGQTPPRKASSTIRSYIWRIDRVLAQAPDGSAQVARLGHGYALRIDPDAVDLVRFRALKRQAEALADSGELRHAAVLLVQAEAIWRGRALSGLPDERVGRLRDSLEEERRAATFRRIELELVLGRHASLLAELSVLAEQHPLDEELAAHRMTALFRSGRQSDALRAYREIRDRLDDEGLEPTAELARLHQHILRHDPELAVTPAYRRPGQEPQPDTLPAVIRDFTGRSEELRTIAEGIGPANGPVVWVIQGMGGVGKTVLAVHVGQQMAQRYPDAKLYLNLHGHDHSREPLDSADALRELLTMLDVPAVRIPGAPRARAELWRAELACRRTLLILDDVTGPEQVLPLLPEAGDSLIIVTSRQRDADWGAFRTMPLQVFSGDDAAALFTQIAGRMADLQPDQVAKVSRLCGYLPLAIRLAASRLRSGAVTSLADLVDELDESVGSADLTSEVSWRVHASFELSYRRLTAREQRFFRYLGMSPCVDTTAYSAAFLADVSLAESQAALASLAGRHLLEETSAGRFGFHDLTRTFAATRSPGNDQRRDIRQGIGRLADYYLRAVNHASQVLRRETPVTDGSDPRVPPLTDTPTAASAWLESEWANVLRVAEQCAKYEFKRHCADLVHAVGVFLEASGHWDDALAAHLIALQACRDLDDVAGAARAALDASLIYLRTGRNDPALQHATEAAEAFGMLGDSNSRAAAFNRIGVIHRNTARFRNALAYHQEALAIYQAAGDSLGLARTLVNAGADLWYLGRLQEEMTYLTRALDIYRENDDLRSHAAALNNIGTVQQARGYHRDAMRSFQSSRDIFCEIGGRQNLALADHNMARVQQYKGNYTAAIAIYRAVLATYRTLGDPHHQAYALADIGSVYKYTEHFDEALAHYENAASMAERADDRFAYCEALCGMAEAHFGSGRLDLALQHFERAVTLAGEIESLYLKAKALNGIAETVLHSRGPDAARIYWREAYDIFAQIGVPEAAAVEIRLQTLDASAS
jgi:DNA-binding SARP family transcriptional activator/tetratricopeptide (TPR) repeat protein